MTDTIEFIKSFWPDLQFTKEDVFSCKPDFIVRFYTNFLAELNDKLSYLINEEEIITDDFDDIQDFEKEVIIYCKVAKIFHKIEQMAPLYLADFYILSAKKMYHYVKFSIHFVIFINNFLDEVGQCVNENLKKLTDGQHLKTLKQQCLQDNAENAESLARLRAVYETMKIKLEEVKKNHEKKINDKMIEEKKIFEKTEETNSLQKEIDNLEYELQMLEDEENDLKGCVVTESDIESLRNTEKYLEKEQQLWDDNADDNISEHLENVERLKKCAKQLANFSFDKLDVETLLQHREQATQSQATHEKINQQLNELDHTIASKDKDIDGLQRELERMQVLFTELKNRITLDEQKDRKIRAEETTNCTANFEACQRVHTEIANMEQDLKKVRDDGSKLEAAFAKLYQRYLVKDQVVTKEFYNTLKNLAKLSEDAYKK